MLLSRFKFDDYKFFNSPLPYTQNDYSNAVGDFISFYSSFGFVRSIYQWDTVLSCGISDLDFILVLKDRIDNGPGRQKFLAHEFKRSAKYFYYHRPLIINENLLSNFNKLFINRIKRLYGQNVRFKELGDAEEKLYKTEILNEIIIRHIPRSILDIVFSGRIDVRRALLILNIIRYSIETFKSIENCQMKSFDNYIEEYNYLRSHWFSLGGAMYRLLFSNMLKAVEISLDFIEFFARCLVKHDLVKRAGGCAGERIKFFGKGHFSIFSGNWQRQNAINDMLFVYKKLKRVIPVFPAPLSYQLADYSQANSAFGRYVQKNTIPTSGGWNFSAEEIAKDRRFLLSSYIDFHESNNIPIADSRFFGYYLKTEQGVRLVQWLKKNIAKMALRSL